MVRDSGKVPGSNSDGRLKQGIAKLEAGKCASDWVCREVLSLPALPTMAEVIDKVHDACHSISDVAEFERACRVAAISIQAGSLLLSRMLRHKS